MSFNKNFAFSIIWLFCFPISALINGDIASKNEMPAAIQIWSMQQNQLQFRCSGTLIAPDVVVTETNCIYDKNHHKRGETLLISNSPKTDFYKPLSDILQRILATVRNDIQHPSENITLLYLNQAVPIKPAILLQSDETHLLMNPEAFYIAGFGISKLPLKSDWFKKMTNYIFENDETRQLNAKHVGLAHLGTLTNHNLEFGQEPNDVHGCPGDEGGPIMVDVETDSVNTKRLIGIISSHSNLVQCQAPTYGIRLDTLASFIHEQLTWGCQKGYRAWCEIPGLLPPGFGEDEPSEVIHVKAEQTTKATYPFFEFSTEEKNCTPQEAPELKTSRQQKSAKNFKIKLESMGCTCLKSRSKH